MILPKFVRGILDIPVTGSTHLAGPASPFHFEVLYQLRSVDFRHAVLV